MPEWSTACVDWAERIREGRSIIPPPIFPEEAEAGLAVMRDLRIVDTPGSPRMADACGQWIFDLAGSIFGAYDAQSGRRLIKEWFVMLPKKNFKSGLAASHCIFSHMLSRVRRVAMYRFLVLGEVGRCTVEPWRTKCVGRLSRITSLVKELMGLPPKTVRQYATCRTFVS
ncbi:hypothetical protein [Delftia acidovorans]|uniref:hypothetical protein n=1 Tax=Delftia acidovorans TaxID=80866 RepID=UPI001ED963D8|nr:hypothetical protein [Delftia acidovorans]